ncbi:MAG: nitroreductase family protein [Acidimicrobiia bacterium]
MDIREAIRTNGAVRSFTDEVVADATVFDILDDARFAPSGGNRQGWRVAIVKDAALRLELAALMRPVWDEYVELSRSGRTPFTVVEPAEYRLASTNPKQPPNALLDDIVSIPVVLVVAADLRRIAMMDKDLDRPPITGGASIYPFCWSILLAARARGLGGVMTTFLSRAEPAAGAALGLPPDHGLATTIFLGHPVHQPTKLRRGEVAEFTTIDRFDGPPFTGETPG